MTGCGWLAGVTHAVHDPAAASSPWAGRRAPTAAAHTVHCSAGAWPEGFPPSWPGDHPGMLGTSNLLMPRPGRAALAAGRALSPRSAQGRGGHVSPGHLLGSGPNSPCWNSSPMTGPHSVAVAARWCRLDGCGGAQAAPKAGRGLRPCRGVWVLPRGTGSAEVVDMARTTGIVRPGRGRAGGARPPAPPAPGARSCLPLPHSSGGRQAGERSLSHMVGWRRSRCPGNN